MKDKPRLYPHPVKNRYSDDLDCEFKIEVECCPEPDNYRYSFNCQAELTSRDLEQLVESKMATYALHVECSATRFRTVIRSNEKTFNGSIASGCLDGKVEILPMVTALQDIDAYKNDNFHEDYGGAFFKIKKGDFLAVGETKEFDAEKEKDPLKSVRSIFSVVADKDPKAKSLNVNLSGARIVIKLSKVNYELYNQLKIDSKLQAILASMIIIPTLIFTLEKVKSHSSDGINEYEDHRWYRVLKHKFRNLGFDIDDPDTWPSDDTIVIAQQIIGEPISHGIKNLNEVALKSSTHHEDEI